MADVTSLLQRIDAEFAAGRQKIKNFQAGQIEAYEGRERRLALFEKTCDKLRDVWRPRLEALSQKFGEQVNVTPRISRGRREATFEFASNLAQIVLRFTISTDQEVHKLVLDYRLEILPILMKFEPHKQAEFPLEAVDDEAVANWIDDRLVDFVRTYLSLHQNEYYLKDHMVSDPIAGVRFPKFAAASTLEWQGQTYYFIGEMTRAEFQKQHAIS
jgi:YHS domain-containing protein